MRAISLSLNYERGKNVSVDKKILLRMAKTIAK